MVSKWNPHVSLGGIVSELSYKLRKKAEKELVAHSLEHISFARFWTLHELYDAPKNQATLCKQLSQRAPSMMEMLNRLKSEGLVKSKSSPTDSRKKLWSLSIKGKRDYLEAKEVLRNVGRGIDNFFEKNKILPDEVERVKEILGTLSQKHFSDV